MITLPCDSKLLLNFWIWILYSRLVNNPNISYAFDIYSDDILMIDIHSDPIKHLLIERLCETNISVFDSKYCNGSEIVTPASPIILIFSLVLHKHTSCLARQP